MNYPELLLPVGNIQMCYAAIHNGADAVYVGMPGFNARGRSHDHSWEELKEIIDTCHLYKVKVHLAFNILIFENELENALETLDKVAALGPDALIVQDLGIASLIRKIYPQMPIHGSTQMTVSNHEAIELLDDLEIKRFVLARENSLDEIKIIRENTKKELEVFVHGALCVAYSGQCFTSESLGGRSANRGQCAQSCRFNYELYVDEERVDLGPKKYLVSPKDLCGISEVPNLQEIGVNSFKVEGRLKTPEYVATAALNYKRKILDPSFDENSIMPDLGVAYSRGFYTGWLGGVAHQELVGGDFKENRGAFIGTVKKQIKGKLLLDLTYPDLKVGDGLLFTTKNKGDEKELGGKVFDIQKDKDTYIVAMGKGFENTLVYEHDLVYLTRNESLVKEVKKSYTDNQRLKKSIIDIDIIIDEIGEVTVSVIDGEDTIQLKSEIDIQAAISKAIGFNDIKEEFNKLSQTPYKLGEISIDLPENIFIHRKLLKSLRQEVIGKLNDYRCLRNHYQKSDYKLEKRVNSESLSSPKLNVLVRRVEQLDLVLEYLSNHLIKKDLIDSIILDYEFGKDYLTSVKKVKEFGILCAIATTRVLKPKEYHNFKLIERCDPDIILIRNLGALNYFKDKKYILRGDFSLNIANSFSFKYLESKGLESICLSYDLNLKQINEMLKSIDASKVEIVIQQYMPEFHMEHCVFAAFLSEGNSFRDCGKPCEKHYVYLKDMYGNRHEIKADQECRNTMFKSEALSGLSQMEDWKGLGASNFRVEFLNESKETLVPKLEIYLNYLEGGISSKVALQKMSELEQFGIGLGNLGKTKEYSSRKKLTP